LHIDAHADLRKAYEGFTESHASIMFNVMETLPIQSLVQVGIRDVSPIEIEYSNSKENIQTHFDWSIKSQLSDGKPWNEISDDIIKPLSETVYISFDIDGLDPKLCPNTGTPVPGGLELWQAQILIERVLASGRKIVGADLVEVAPGPNGDQWDGNVGARCAFMLACAIVKSI
jgi:agmatinase